MRRRPSSAAAHRAHRGSRVAYRISRIGAWPHARGAAASGGAVCCRMSPYVGVCCRASPLCIAAYRPGGHASCLSRLS
ncbi:hypothetical protein BURPS1106B_0963 [Burkholderia pseudomallei 1106b]|uniref:Uncharacterized protein n=1 Tax=Burkholderia pseudomallei (strain 1106a) TaxID=357348 RepID=A3P402_BURP0|nr:hypothetical protein BURPS1106A_A1026 [Burkholderia pseudomallei 1106a]EEC37749.1 conserved hypothetical protein [Burkholderia pseudomallei 576]EEP51276.1 conserved hypothetical protein [Burkholderia pseudomallei MSHR346]EES21999.1 hypothetical protein BURPS1106B_0963 [Burkholderia pseudomallei 1106b]